MREITLNATIFTGSMRASEYEKYVHFCNEMSKVLNLAKPNLQCEFKVWSQADKDTLEHDGWTFDMRGNNLIVGDWYVVVNCMNGHKYYINMTGNSLAAIAEEVFQRMVCK